jgi:hypothetical protein
MLDFLRGLSERKWKGLIDNPSFKQDKMDLRAKIQKIPEEHRRCLWEDDMGLCTSWCIAVAQKINNDNMNYGDQGNHRAAYTNDGIIIHSSARQALLIKDEAVTIEIINGRWRIYRHQMQNYSQ